MTWDNARADAIIEAHKALDGAALPILHALQKEFGYIDDAAIAPVAKALNLSRAEIHGVVTFQLTTASFARAQARSEIARFR